MKYNILFKVYNTLGKLNCTENRNFKLEFEYRYLWGNLRTAFTDSDSLPFSGVYSAPIITQINDYDLLGFEHFNNQSGKNNHLFQKQERVFDLDLGWDFWKFRPSDAVTGRFMIVDPLSEKYPFNSLYAIQENKFALGVELEGSEVQPFYPNLQGELYKSTGVSTASDPQKIGGELLKSYVKSLLTIMIKALPIEDLALGVLGLAVKEIGLIEKAKAIEITIDAAKYPESAKHLDDAIKAGKSNEGVIDRAGTTARRKENLKTTETVRGKDRDEAPPAVIKTKTKSSVRAINSNDNRGSVSSIGKQIKNLPDGTKVKITPKNLQ